MERRFTWGDLVLILKNAPSPFHPGELASVCGFYQVTSKDIAQDFHCDIGDWIYTVEFGDGSDVEVPGTYLMKLENSSNEVQKE
jgi:hypothetical protein